MKVKPKLKKNHKLFCDLEPGDLFRLPDTDTILMKLVKLSAYNNTVNVTNGYPGYLTPSIEVILVEGEFIEK